MKNTMSASEPTLPFSPRTRAEMSTPGAPGTRCQDRVRVNISAGTGTLPPLVRIVMPAILPEVTVTAREIGASVRHVATGECRGVDDAVGAHRVGTVPESVRFPHQP